MTPEKIKKRRLEKRKKRIKARLIKKDGVYRLTLFRGNKNLCAQIIDDMKGITRVSASTNEKDFSKITSKSNIESAKKLGELIAQRAKEKDISNVVFDRNGILYHGKVRAFAETAREKGLKF